MLRCGTSDKRHSDIAKDVQDLSRTPTSRISSAQFNSSQTPDTDLVAGLYSRKYAGRRHSGTATAFAQALLLALALL